jgi:hypothetical protein
VAAVITTLTPDVLAPFSDPALDAQIAAAFAGDAKSVDVSRLLPEVEAAAKAADAAAGEARSRALDPLLSRDDVKDARREREDAAFVGDRLHEAGKKLVARIEALKSVEADGRMWAEQQRVEAERDKLAEEMENMADPIMQIAHLVPQIEACDGETGRLNATSTSRFGYVRPVLSGAAPAVAVLFGDAIVWDTFIAAAGLQSPPNVPGGAGAKDKPRVRRSASSLTALFSQGRTCAERAAIRRPARPDFF